MTNLTHLLSLAQDAAGTAKAGAQVASENITGARDPNYIKRQSTIDIDVINGRMIGIRVGLPQRIVDTKMIEVKREQNSKVAFNQLKQEFAELLDDINGSLESNGSIDQKLLNFSQKAASLTAEAGSSILRRNAVESVKEFTSAINNFARAIEDQRNIADKGVFESVKEVNVLTKKLFILNEEIATGVHREQDVTALETQRETVVENIAKLANIQAVKSESKIFVYTVTGKPLVEYKHYPLEYTTSGMIDYSATYPVNINPVGLVNDRGVATDVTLEITGGKLGAYLEMRDKVYPNYQETIDNLAKMVQENVNYVHNKGTGFPPPATLTGTLFVPSTDRNLAASWNTDATVRIAITDQSGKFADPGGGVFYMDLNLNPGGAAALTPIEIRDQINAAFGVNVASFSETPTANSSDDYGYLSLDGPGGLRVSIGEVDGEASPETALGVGFSEYFHLNDLITSVPDVSGGGGYSNSLAVRKDISDDQSLFSIAKLNSRLDIALVGIPEQTMGITAGDGRNLIDIRESINDPSVAFPAAGRMPADTTSFITYVKNTINMINLDASSSIDESKFSSEVLDGLERRHALISGVTQDEEIGEIMAQKLFYKGVMSTSQHLIEMLNSLLEVFGRS